MPFETVPENVKILFLSANTNHPHSEAKKKIEIFFYAIFPPMRFFYRKIAFSFGFILLFLFFNFEIVY